MFDIFFPSKSLPPDAVDLVVKDVDGTLHKEIKKVQYAVDGGLSQRSMPMNKYLLAAALIVGLATPALAADYYVALKLGGAAGACEVMTTEPNPTTHKMMGKYSSEAEAKKAMGTMKECQ